MSERELEPLAPAVENPDEKANLVRLPKLIDGARQASQPDQTVLAQSINETLIAMRSPGHALTESSLVLEALEAHHLDGLVDSLGRACRKEAVETLLACGFPYALKVAPEDLAFARTYVQRRPEGLKDDGPEPPWVSKMRNERRVAMALVVVFQAISAVMTGVFADVQSMTLNLALTFCAISAFAFVKFAFDRPNPEEQGRFGATAGILAFAQAATALVVGLPALVGVAGTALGLIVCFSSQGTPLADPPKPGDWDYDTRRRD